MDKRITQVDPTQPIKVWRFYAAPQELQELSKHGGDEEWLAVVPPGFPGADWIPWMESGTQFGVCDVSYVDLLDGSTVYIGAHA